GLRSEVLGQILRGPRAAAAPDRGRRRHRRLRGSGARPQARLGVLRAGPQRRHGRAQAARPGPRPGVRWALPHEEPALLHNDERGGLMAVVKRGKSWAYTIEVGEPGGRRRQKWVGGFATKREALLSEAKARTSRAQGTYVEATRETVGSYLTAYLERIRPPAS